MREHGQLPVSIDTRAAYRIQVQGCLDPTWVTEMCDTIEVSHAGGMGKRAVTTLSGELEDQAVLLGILNLVYDLGYPLLSLTYLGRPDEAYHDHG